MLRLGQVGEVEKVLELETAMYVSFWIQPLRNYVTFGMPPTLSVFLLPQL